MALFVVLALEGSAPAIKAGVETNFADNFYEVENGKWLVATALVTAKQVSDRIGITGDEGNEGPAGMVVRIGGYFGRASKDMWEWIAAKSIKTGA